MRILSLHIENFGKFSNFDINFSDKINQFVYENGWGKSTLCAFIKAMFYGMEAKGRKKDFQSERSKFEPWQGGNYGGSLTIEVKGKKYQIFRQFGKTPEEDSFQLFDLNSNKITNDYSESIGTQLFGVGAETFVISAFFGQNDLSSSSTDEMVSNLAGIEKYKNDGEKTDFAIKLLEKNRKELVANLPKEAELKQIERSSDRLNLEIENLTNLLNSVESQNRQLNKEKQEFEKIFDGQKEAARQQKKLLEEKMRLQEEFNNKNMQLSQLTIQKPKRKPFSRFLPFAILSFVVALIFILLFAFNVLSVEIGLSVGVLFLLAGGLLLAFKSKTNDRLVEKEIYELKSVVQRLRDEIEKYPDVKEFDYDSLYQQKVEFEQKCAQVSAKKFNLGNEIENRQEELSILQGNKNKLETERTDGLEKIELLKKTMSFLKMARENVSERFVAPLNENFKHLFEGFKGIEKVSIDSSLNPWVLTSQGAKNVEFLSQGYRDLVVICQRFSLLDKVYKREKPCIILDDSFVNLDDQNFAMVKPILKELAASYQVLYFSCSESRKII